MRWCVRTNGAAVLTSSRARCARIAASKAHNACINDFVAVAIVIGLKNEWSSSGGGWVAKCANYIFCLFVAIDHSQRINSFARNAFAWETNFSRCSNQPQISSRYYTLEFAMWMRLGVCVCVLLHFAFIYWRPTICVARMLQVDSSSISHSGALLVTRFTIGAIAKSASAARRADSSDRLEWFSTGVDVRRKIDYRIVESIHFRAGNERAQKSVVTRDEIVSERARLLR